MHKSAVSPIGSSFAGRGVLEAVSWAMLEDSTQADPSVSDAVVIPGLETCLFQFPGDQTAVRFTLWTWAALCVWLQRGRQSWQVSYFKDTHCFALVITVPNFRLVDIALCMLVIIHLFRMK